MIYRAGIYDSRQKQCCGRNIHHMHFQWIISVAGGTGLLFLHMWLQCNANPPHTPVEYCPAIFEGSFFD